MPANSLFFLLEAIGFEREWCPHLTEFRQLSGFRVSALLYVFECAPLAIYNAQMCCHRFRKASLSKTTKRNKRLSSRSNFFRPPVRLASLKFSSARCVFTTYKSALNKHLPAWNKALWGTPANIYGRFFLFVSNRDLYRFYANHLRYASCVSVH